MANAQSGQHEWLKWAKEIEMYDRNPFYYPGKMMNLLDTTAVTPTERTAEKNKFVMQDVVPQNETFLKIREVATNQTNNLLDVEYYDLEERIMTYMNSNLDSKLQSIYGVDKVIVKEPIVEPIVTAELPEPESDLYENKTPKELLEILSERDFYILDLEAEISELEKDRDEQIRATKTAESRSDNIDNAIEVLANYFRIKPKEMEDFFVEFQRNIDRNKQRNSLYSRSPSTNLIYPSSSYGSLYNGTF